MDKRPATTTRPWGNNTIMQSLLDYGIKFNVILAAKTPAAMGLLGATVIFLKTTIFKKPFWAASQSQRNKAFLFSKLILKIFSHFISSKMSFKKWPAHGVPPVHLVTLAVMADESQ